VLSEQGKSSKETACYLCKGLNTIHNQITTLFAKIGVHTMQEAIEYANSHSMIYPKGDVQHQPVEESRRRTRVTKDMLQSIQQYLDEAKSIRKIAKQIGIAESTIRSWISKGKLKK
jgi:DNA-binding NarL/FixJ family response regulator